jgi:hypothetical protein
VEVVSASPGDEEAEGWLEKKEPMLIVPTGGAIAAWSIGRERRAASDAGRWPAVEDPEREALDMAATEAPRVTTARVWAARAAARVWAEAWNVPSLIPCDTMQLWGTGSTLQGVAYHIYIWVCHTRVHRYNIQKLYIV